MQLSLKQSEFLKQALEGKNIFLTGKAGTGKTFIVKEAIKLLKYKKVATVAFTGIAANNVGGVTIHSLFGLNPFGVLSFETCNFLKGEKRRVLNAIEVLFIDEVSMLRPDILDAINWTLLKNGCDGIDSKQIIFVGDLKQLPAPIDDNMRSILYRNYHGEEFYNAKIYPKLNVIDIELDEVQRQSDSEFIQALNIVREGGKSPYFRKFLTDTPKGVILAPHLATVKKYNQDGLNSLIGEEIVFNAIVDGNIKAEDFNFETQIRVKEGARIMYLMNSKNNNLFNGTQGFFKSLNGKHFITVDGCDFALEPIEVTKKEYVLNEHLNALELQDIGSIKQYPIKLAYAMTIHKSQGLSLDEMTIDLRKPCFAKGQLYVALSRAKTPEGLNIIANI